MKSPRWSLTRATLKAWFRDKQALFFTFLLPVVFMGLFGILNFGSFGNIDIGIVDQANNEASRGFVNGLRPIKTFKIKESSDLEEERQELLDGKRDMLLIIPESFRTDNPSKLQVLYNQSQAAEVQVGQSILRQALDEMTFAITGTTRLFELDMQPVNGQNTRYVDFLTPGIIAMAVMQMGLFSIVFAIVQLKQKGIIRRLQATPLKASDIMFAQVATRVIVALMVTLILIGVGVFLFDVSFKGNILLVLLIAVMGAGVFLSMGFAIAGVAKTEESAAPIANIVTLPQMFLSGIFFSRDVIPGVIKHITDYLPLTFLADSLRNVAIQGQGVSDVWPQLIGLAIWTMIMGLLASRLFRWE